MLGLDEMKKRKFKIKEITKIRFKRTRESMTGKQINQKEPDLQKILSSKLQTLVKAYKGFREKRKIERLKDEQIKLKKEEEIRLETKKRRLEEAKKLKEERKIQKEEEKRLKAKKLKEEQQELERKEQIYKERLARGEKERLLQLEEANALKVEQKKLREERYLKEERRSKKEEAIFLSLKKKTMLKEIPKLQNEEKNKLKEEQKIKEQKEQRLRGKVKWFNRSKGYGFIEREDKEKDVFVHFSNVREAGLKYLNKGDELTFEINNTDKGSLAINLHKISQFKKED